MYLRGFQLSLPPQSEPPCAAVILIVPPGNTRKRVSPCDDAWNWPSLLLPTNDLVELSTSAEPSTYHWQFEPMAGAARPLRSACDTHVNSTICPGLSQEVSGAQN